MCFNNKYNRKTNETQNKHSLKDCTEKFFNILYKNIIRDKIILFDAAY